MTKLSTDTDLFNRVQMGALRMSNRIFIAPVTRSRYA